MNRRVRTAVLGVAVVALLGVAAHGQGRQGGPPGPPATGGRGGGAQPAPTPPRPLIVDARPVRSCESLAQVALPDTAIESAAVDPNNPDICRVTAIVSHPPAPDRIVVWIGIPTSNWNGRFVGTGGGGFSAGSAGGVMMRLSPTTDGTRL